jgi:hypothetical protein
MQQTKEAEAEALVSVKSSFMEMPVGKRRENLFLPFHPCYFEQFGCILVFVGSLEKSGYSGNISVAGLGRQFTLPHIDNKLGQTRLINFSRSASPKSVVGAQEQREQLVHKSSC